MRERLTSAMNMQHGSGAVHVLVVETLHVQDDIVIRLGAHSTKLITTAFILFLTLSCLDDDKIST